MISVKHIKSDIYGWIFRILIIAVVVSTIIFDRTLPAETDSYFQVGKTEHQSAIESVLFNGDFYWVKDDNTRELIEVPGEYDVEPGKIFVVETTLPADYNCTSFIVRASQQKLRIYIDDELRVNYDTESSRPYGTQTTSRYVICSTDATDAGKTVRIETVSYVKGYSGIINQVYAGDKFDFWHLVYLTYGSDTIFGLTILLLGLFTIGISVFLSIGFKRSFELEYIGWCVFLSGGWLAGESKLRQLIMANTSALSNICFLIIMLAPYPLLLCVDKLQKKRYSRVYTIANLVVIANFCIQCLLQILNVANFLDMLSVSHILIGLSCIIAIVTAILDYRQGLLRSYRGTFLGLLILMAAVLSEVMWTYFVTMVTGFILTIGVIIFLSASVISTINDIRSSERRHNEERLKEQQHQSEIMSMQMIKNMTDTLESKDEYTRGHSNRVAEYSALLAREIGMDSAAVAKLHYAASLHDIGKIGIPDTILNKPLKLTDEEFDIIKSHTTMGADILKDIKLISYAEGIARYHHEHYDGTGYPSGIAGDKIPLEARIVALADAYDAMNSQRIYRQPLAKESIRAEIENNLGLQFDPELGRIFLTLMDRGMLELDSTTDKLIGTFEYEKKYSATEDAGKMMSLLFNTMNTRSDSDDLDLLTGLPMRGRGEILVHAKMVDVPGTLVLFDMDNLKKINDTYGHQAGDRALRLVGRCISSDDKSIIACRIGGDEFLLYLPYSEENKVVEIVERAINDFEEAKKEDKQISVASLSAGICICDAKTDYAENFAKADKALYYVKHRGKMGYHIFNDEKNSALAGGSDVDMKKIVESIRKAGDYEGALELEYREFTKMYEYMANLCERYKHTCQFILITLSSKPGESIYIDNIESAMSNMELAIRENIRNVDVCTRYSSVQFFVILLEAEPNSIDMIMNRIFDRFHSMDASTKFKPDYETQSMLED